MRTDVRIITAVISVKEDWLNGPPSKGFTIRFHLIASIIHSTEQRVSSVIIISIIHNHYIVAGIS